MCAIHILCRICAKPFSKLASKCTVMWEGLCIPHIIQTYILRFFILHWCWYSLMVDTNWLLTEPMKISHIVCVCVCVCVYIYIYIYIYFIWRNRPTWSMASLFTRFLDHTKWRATVGGTPLNEWSARRRDLYLTTYNTHNRQSSPPVGFEPTISAGERPQNNALHCADAGTGHILCITVLKSVIDRAN